MRKVKITGIPPADWVAEANELTLALRAATTKDERNRIIELNEKLWRDDRIRDWLLSQFNNKCWYTEAEDSVSAYHVDHFRPKGRITNSDGTFEDGYWWLSFNYENYVIAGQLINVKKRDKFPILDGERRADHNSNVLLEGFTLIDPKSDDTRMISYERDDDGCIAVHAGGIINPVDLMRVEQTIDILGLNRLSRLNQKRGKIWDECLASINDYQSANMPGAYALSIVHKTLAVTKLKEKIQYGVEFSSIAQACILKKAPEPLIASVFD